MPEVSLVLNGVSSAGAPSCFAFVDGVTCGKSRGINRIFAAPAGPGTGVLDGTLNDLGTDPTLVLEPRRVVAGKVYRIPAALQHQLDVVEGVWRRPDGQYHRRDVWVRLIDGTQDTPDELACLVCKATSPHTTGKLLMACSDWVHYR